MEGVGSHSEKEKALLYTAVQDSCKTLEASKIEATGIKTPLDVCPSPNPYVIRKPCITFGVKPSDNHSVQVSLHVRLAFPWNCTNPRLSRQERGPGSVLAAITSLMTLSPS